MVGAGAAGVVGAGAGATPSDESFMTWPIRIRFALVIPLMLIKFLVVVPKRDAIPLRESPRTTVYDETGAGAAGAGEGDVSGVAVGVGAGAEGSGAGAEGSGAGAEGSGVGVAASLRAPFSRTNLPTKADIASPATKALT